MALVRTMWLSLLAAIAGCAARGDVELLEAHVRTQQDRIASLQTELDHARNRLGVLQQDNDQLRAQLTGRGEPVVRPEQAEALFSVTGIRIPRMLASGLEVDGRSGDDEFTLLVVPHDAGGGVVKLPGELTVELHEPAPGGEQRSLGTWSWTTEESRRLWQQDVFGGGLRIREPWQTVPQSSELHVEARLTTVDGREFTATQQFEVRPPGASEPPALAPASAEKAPPFDDRPIPPDRFSEDLRDPNGQIDRTRPLRTSDSFTKDALRRYH